VQLVIGRWRNAWLLQRFFRNLFPACGFESAIVSELWFAWFAEIFLHAREMSYSRLLDWDKPVLICYGGHASALGVLTVPSPDAGPVQSGRL